jgi:hypothetical protein
MVWVEGSDMAPCSSGFVLRVDDTISHVESTSPALPSFCSFTNQVITIRFTQSCECNIFLLATVSCSCVTGKRHEAFHEDDILAHNSLASATS